MAEAGSELNPSDGISQEEIQKKIEEVEYTGRKTGPTLGMIIGIIGAVWSLFQLWIASPLPFLFDFGIIVGVPARGIHLAFAFLLVFLMFPAAKSMAHRRISYLDIAFALLACFCALWVFIDQEGITRRLGQLLSIDLFGSNFPIEAVLGGCGILLLLESTRRAIGLPLVIVASIFLLYSIFGQSMPEILSHRGVSVTRLIGYHWIGGEAIFGIPIDVSVSFVFLFVLFGALLDRAGAGKYFLDLAFAMVGKYRGGPAKAAILASGMTGLISGSSIANVVTTGVFTIPVMRKTGFPAVKAGAIEVAASTNGQIMPPIMGAAAFIIAELIGITYFDVIVAAFIPAIISYIGLLYISHLEALKLGLSGMAKEDIPVLRKVFFSGVHFIVPIVVLVYLLMVERWTASSAVFYTIMVMFLIMFATRISPSNLSRAAMVVLYIIPIAISVAFRISGEKAQPSLFWGLGAAVMIVVALGLMRSSKEGDVVDGLKASIIDIYGGLIAGARNMVGIAVAVATAGIIVGAVSSTGLNNAMVGVVEALSGGNVYILLILTAVLSLVLGMGLPTTANYLVVASLLAGVLVELGTAAGLELPLIAVHLFVFYFGLMADSTPPVCLAAFAASAISRADPLKTGVQAFTYDMRTAILPFVFIFNPELLLIGVTSVWHGIMIFVVSLIAIFSFSSATQGWLIIKTTVAERVILLVVMFALFRPDFFLNQIYPEYTEMDINKFVTNQVQAPKDRKVRLHSVRETDYGERFKLYVLRAPGGKAGQGAFGLKLEKEKDGRLSVADLAPSGKAEKVKMDFGDYVTSVEVEQIDRPAKELVYPIALIILGGVLLMQWNRRKKGGVENV
ncbi:MAG: TRAP transporter permease [Rhodospirillaceae bacterium]|jgi:TRAP transporter 4TM/12TM fusion protein|nr:TRAP transporter permease [Rhodospirillaceae bacterium]MBT5939851.1 TRAP transporter permease [Rhodospirillaceae bacterium]